MGREEHKMLPGWSKMAPGWAKMTSKSDPRSSKRPKRKKWSHEGANVELHLDIGGAILDKMSPSLISISTF